MKNNRIKDIYTTKLYNAKRVKRNIINNGKEEYRMNKYIKYAVGVTTLAFILLVGFSFFNKEEKVMKVDYKGYLKESSVIDSKKNSLNKDISNLYSEYVNGNINEEEYFSKLDILKDKYEDTIKEEKKIKKDYKIDNELDLDKVKFSDNEEEDKELKELYMLKKELELKDTELDILEDKLDDDYKNGLITKEEFITKKEELELKDDELEKEEDKLDLLEEKYDTDDEEDKEDNDDDDDDDFEEDDEDLD